MERSKRIVFVSHCILNQNALPLGRERSPGSIKELIELFSESDIGIVQIPCPQVEFNGGLSRRTPGRSHSLPYKKYCKQLSFDILKQVEKYIKKKYSVVGILGVELSQTCGVHRILNGGNKAGPGKGILVETLEEQMHKKNFQVPLIGVDMNNVFSSMKKVKSLIRYSS